MPMEAATTCRRAVAMAMMVIVCLLGIMGSGGVTAREVKENGGAGDGATGNEKPDKTFDDNGNLPVGHKIALLMTGLTEPEFLAPNLVLPSIMREIITPLGPQNVDCFVHTSSLKGGGEDAVAEVYSRLGQSLAALVYVENYRGPERVHVRRPKRLPKYLHALHGGTEGAGWTPMPPRTMRVRIGCAAIRLGFSATFRTAA